MSVASIREAARTRQALHETSQQLCETRQILQLVLTRMNDLQYVHSELNRLMTSVRSSAQDNEFHRQMGEIVASISSEWAMPPSIVDAIEWNPDIGLTTHLHVESQTSVKQVCDQSTQTKQQNDWNGTSQQKDPNGWPEHLSNLPLERIEQEVMQLENVVPVQSIQSSPVTTKEDSRRPLKELLQKQARAIAMLQEQNRRLLTLPLQKVSSDSERDSCIDTNLNFRTVLQDIHRLRDQLEHSLSSSPTVDSAVENGIWMTKSDAKG